VDSLLTNTPKRYAVDSPKKNNIIYYKNGSLNQHKLVAKIDKNN
jgi:hypothetical protein